jgi:MFS family permease
MMLASILLIANTKMFTGKQVIMTATLYGMGFTVFGLMQGPPQPILAKIIQKIGPRKPLIFDSIVMILTGLLGKAISNAGTFVMIYGLGYGTVNLIILANENFCQSCRGGRTQTE